MLRFCVFFLLVLSRPVMADTSWFFKLVVLRFGTEETITAQKGIAAVGSVDPQRFYHIVGTVPLISGEFVQPQFLDDDALAQLLRDKKAVENPLRLKTYPYPQPEPGPNFGTFILKFKRQSQGAVVLNIPRYFHAMELFYASRKEVRLIQRYDTLDLRPENNRNSNRYLSPNMLLPEDDGDFIIFAHVTSPLVDGRSILNFPSLHFGQASAVESVQLLSRYAVNAISGGFLIIFLFYAFISVFRPKDRPSRYLALYAGASFGMSLLQTMDFKFPTARLIDYYTVFNLMTIGSLELYTLDKIKVVMSRFWTRNFKMLAIVVTLSAVAGILLDVRGIVSPLLILSFIGCLALIVLTVYVGIRHRQEGTEYFMVGAVLNIIFQYPTLLTYVNGSNVENGYYILLANFSIAISLALVNAKDFAATYHNLDEKNREITFLNKNLENLVALKTQDVRSLLDHIPQGVLSIGQGGIIQKDFSAHLGAILGTNEVAGRSFRDLVLTASNLDSDTRDQVWQTLLSCLGESELTFELNVTKLPSDLTLLLAGEARHLKVTWNIRVDKGTVAQVLVTLLDVTHEKALEQTAAEHRFELNLIDELVQVPANKVAQFFESSWPLLKENEKIIQDHESLDEHAVKLLFVNAHTIKGAARSLQFKSLAHVIHEAEEVYSHALREKIRPDPARLRSDIKKIMARFESYREVNRNKLNRAEDLRKVTVDRDRMEQLHISLQNLAKKSSLSMESLIEEIDKQTEILSSMIFERSLVIFEDYRERARTIAKDLGKEAPEVVFDVEDFSVSPVVQNTLNRCMVHFLRNALDHGIETAEERQAAGKNPRGRIEMVGRVHDRCLTISLSDDGRGLAVEKLRQLAAKAGYASPAMPPQDVAALIFEAGFSTASTVSDISGRGVGLHAVRSFVEKQGGSVHLKLGAAMDPEGRYYRFHFILTLPLVAPELQLAV